MVGRSLLLLVALVAVERQALGQDLNCRGVLHTAEPPALVTLDIVRRDGEFMLRHGRIGKTPVTHATVSMSGAGPLFTIAEPKATFALPVVNAPGNLRGLWTQDGKQTPFSLNCRATVPVPDNSPHTVRSIEVQPGVQLEVLDWGGSGTPVILLHGLAATAHDFDQFAPRLAAEYRVIAVTRRGSGRSSVPDTGYSHARLADDVLAVADSMALVKPVLIGHSLGGADLSAVASRALDRIAGLVYLDAGYPYAYIDSARVATFQAKPEEMYECPCSAVEHVQNGSRLYTRIAAPVLAIFKVDAGWDTPGYSGADPWTPAQQVREFEKGVPTARVVRIPGATHRVFASHEAQVLSEIRAFIGSLPPRAKR